MFIASLFLKNIYLLFIYFSFGLCWVLVAACGLSLYVTCYILLYFTTVKKILSLKMQGGLYMSYRFLLTLKNFIYLFVLLEDNCFTECCYFLSKLNMNQP